MTSLLSFSLPKPNIIKATASATPTTTPISSPEALDDKFRSQRHRTNNVPFVEPTVRNASSLRLRIPDAHLTSYKLTVRNASSLRLRIPDAHLTSYKPKIYWKDDGLEEILYKVPLPVEPALPSPKEGLVWLSVVQLKRVRKARFYPVMTGP